MTTKEEILNKSRPIIIGNYYIYALLYRNEIVYIGQSTSLITRLAAHVNSNKVFDAWQMAKLDVVLWRCSRGRRPRSQTYLLRNWNQWGSWGRIPRVEENKGGFRADGQFLQEKSIF